MTPVAEVRAELAGALREVFAPSCPLNCWEWAEENVFLTPLESRDNHGRYDSSLTPYVRRMMEFVTTAGETEFIIRKSAQLGFTLAYLIIIAYLAATRPTHVLYGMDSLLEAKRISQNRLLPMLRNCKAVADSFTSNDDDITAVLIRLRRMWVYMVGSGAAGAYKNKSIGLGILDELDAHEVPTVGGANTIDLMRDRLKEVEGGKLIAGGTPEGWDGETNLNYLTGTREELFIFCPKCGTEQPIRLEQLRFDHCKSADGEWDFNRIRRETFLECVKESCNGRMTDEDKPALLRGGVTKPTNTGQDEHKPFPGRVSLWVNDFHSFRPKNDWGAIAVDWVGSQDSPSKMRRFFNSRLGLPRKDKATKISRSDLKSLTEGYDHGCVPVMPAIHPETGVPAIFVASDVQSDVKKWAKVAFTADNEAYVIDYGSTLSYDELLLEADKPVLVGMRGPSPDELDQLTAEAFNAGAPLLEHLEKAFPGKWLISDVGIIDEGHDTHVTREWCVSTADPETGQPRFFPTKGVARTTVRDIVDEKAGKFFANGQPITVYHFSDHDLKSELYRARIAGQQVGPKSKKRPAGLHLPAHVEGGFVEELMQERYEEVTVRGRKSFQWIEPTKPNDFGDAVKMACVLWHVVKPEFLPGTEDRVARADDPRPDPSGSLDALTEPAAVE